MYFRQDLGLNPAYNGLIIEFKQEKAAFSARKVF